MDDNEFECTNCGYRLSLDMTRCPRCGMNLYPEDEDGEYTLRRAGADELWPGARVRTTRPPRRMSRPRGPAIEETETSVILSLPDVRTKPLFEWTRSLFGPSVILALLLAMLLTKPSSIIGNIILGIAALATVLYSLGFLLLGRDVLEVSREGISVHSELWVWKRTRFYAASQTQGLRVSEATSGAHPSTIACEYAGKNLALIQGVNAPLAKSFVALAKQRFPGYR